MIGRVLTTALLLWGATATGLTPPAHASPDARRFLLAVGTNEGLPAEGRLNYAESDARAFAVLMGQIGQVAAADTRVLTGPTPAALDAALDTLRREMVAHGRDAILFFYFSGHGDDDSLHLGKVRYPLTRLEAQLKALPTTLRFAVIDACRGKSDVKTKGFARTQAFAVNLESPAGLEGVVTLKSSSEGEDSQESSQLRGAVFTHYLLTALRGAADVDRDKRVTLSEAYTYAYRQTVRRSASGPGNVMHPSVDADLEGAGALVLTRTRPDTVRVTLPKGNSQQYLIFDRPTGAVHAEVWSDPQRSIPVALPAGGYLIHRRAGDESGAAEVRLREGEARTLYASDFRRLPRALLARKGGQLRLFHRELRLGGGGAVMHAGQPGYGARLRYGVGAVTWTLSLAIDWGQTEYTTEHDRRAEEWLGTTVGLDLRHFLGPIDLLFSGTLRAVEQRLRRLDGDLVERAGFAGSFGFDGYLGGPQVGLGWRYPVAGDLDLAVSVTGSLLVAVEGDDTTLRPELGGTLDVAYEF